MGSLIFVAFWSFERYVHDCRISKKMLDLPANVVFFTDCTCTGDYGI